MQRKSKPKGKIIVLFGLTGTGKTTVAERLKERTKGVHINSDVVRKEMAGISPYERLKEGFKRGIYSEEFTEKVYKKLIDDAVQLAKKGRNVVVDATFSKRKYRDDLRKKAKEFNIPTYFFFLSADEESIVKRLRKRESEKTVSDADVEVFEKMKKTFDYPKDEMFFLIKTDEKTPEEIAEEIAKLIEGGENEN